jgi:uncharacterized protein YcgL (UPF0745 family)
MDPLDFYNEAHLFVAAVRVLTHQSMVPPSVEAVCQCLSFSMEQGQMIANRLETMGIIDSVTGAYGAKLYIRNHPALEEIPKTLRKSSMEQEVQRFQAERKDFSKKVESLKVREAEKKKNLFAQLEKQLKNDVEKHKPEASQDPR